MKNTAFRNSALNSNQSRQSLEIAIASYIRRYGASSKADGVFNRILNDQRGAEAFSNLKVNDEDAAIILNDAVLAKKIMDDFQAIITREKSFEARFEDLKQCIAELQKFVSEVVSPPHAEAGLSATIRLDDQEISSACQGLYVIDQMLDLRRRVALETPPRLGATRKTNSSTACENAGIAWFSDGVKRVTGKPNLALVTVLAELSLGLQDLSEDRVRKVLKSRETREWRQPL